MRLPQKMSRCLAPFLCLLLQIAQCCALAYSNAGPGYSPNNKPIQAAVHTRHSVSLKNVDLPQNKPLNPGTIEVKGAVSSFVIKFNSASTKLNLFQKHEPGKAPAVKETFSEDDAHVLKHTVTKPIFQEVRELIFPSRRIVQQIQPVIQTIRTIVSTTSKSSHQTQKQSPASLPLPPPSAVESVAPKLPVTVDTIPPVNSAPIKMARKNVEEEDVEKPSADLVLDETNMIDNSLYNGNSEIELKYVSPNGKSKMAYNDYQNEQHFLHVPRLYKDRR